MLQPCPLYDKIIIELIYNITYQLKNYLSVIIFSLYSNKQIYYRKLITNDNFVHTHNFTFIKQFRISN